MQQHNYPKLIWMKQNVSFACSYYRPNWQLIDNFRLHLSEPNRIQTRRKRIVNCDHWTAIHHNFGESSRFYQTNNYFTRLNILWHMIIKTMTAAWKKDKKWVIKTVLISKLRFYKSLFTKYGWYERLFSSKYNIFHFNLYSWANILPDIWYGGIFLPDQHRFYQSGPTILQGLGKTVLPPKCCCVPPKNEEAFCLLLYIEHTKIANVPPILKCGGNSSFRHLWT